MVGKFVTIEGPNGSGKTTLLKNAGDGLRQLGWDVLETTEPTCGELGSMVRQWESLYAGMTYACLVAADRYHHIENDILPAVEQGKLVLSARYIESSLVLQRLDGLDIETIWKLNHRVLVPDISILLNVSAYTISQRMAGRLHRSRFESNHSAEEEVQYYAEASTFLRAHGFVVVSHDNDALDVHQSASALVDLIDTRLRS